MVPDDAGVALAGAAPKFSAARSAFAVDPSVELVIVLMVAAVLDPGPSVSRVRMPEAKVAVAAAVVALEAPTVPAACSAL
jgi:hypothetical protein